MAEHKAPACKLPHLRGRRVDTLWSCPVCGEIWVMRRWYSYAGKHQFWKKTGLKSNDLD
jgi:ribosomal protein L37AE/L43A